MEASESLPVLAASAMRISSAASGSGFLSAVVLILVSMTAALSPPIRPL